METSQPRSARGGEQVTRAAYRWKGRWHRGEVSLALLNLTGKKYIAWTEPDPDGNSYFPGPTAQVFAGVHLWLGPN